MKQKTCKIYACRYYFFGRQLLAPDNIMSRFLKGVASLTYLIKYENVTLVYWHMVSAMTFDVTNVTAKESRCKPPPARPPSSPQTFSKVGSYGFFVRKTNLNLLSLWNPGLLIASAFCYPMLNVNFCTYAFTWVWGVSSFLGHCIPKS